MTDATQAARVRADSGKVGSGTRLKQAALGFAVTLGVGIITSFFTSFSVTRLIVVTWLKTMRPKRLAL